MKFSLNGRAKREIGAFSLTMAGITCIVGSGWLFGAYRVAQLSGPAAILAWIIGGFATLLVVLTVCELSTMLPKSGGMVHYLNESHGALTGFISAWANWIALVALIPTEASASVQYLASWKFDWAQHLFDVHTATMTPWGLLAASILMIIFFLLNYWSLQLFIKSSNFITYFKIIIPILTSILLISAGFHSQNFTAVNHSFAPYGWSSVLTSISTCGIVFAFGGFHVPVSLSGEAKRAGKTVPIAIISSLLFCIALYVLLQIAFIGAVEPTSLKNGWQGLLLSSPFAQLAIALNLNYLVILLYADAFISPSGTGLNLMAAVGRMLYGMQQNKQMPKYLGKLDIKYGIPRRALVTNLLVSFIFLFIFRGWGHLAAVISVALVISYLAGPIALSSLRIKNKDAKRPFKLPFANIISPLAFIVSALVLYWARWPLTGNIIIVIICGLFIYFYYQTKNGFKNFKKELRSSMWMITFLITIAFISYIGGNDFGGLGIIHNGWDQALVSILSLGFYFWGKFSYYKEDRPVFSSSIN